MAMLAHGSPFELNAVGIVDQTIQDGIRGGRISDLLMPMGDGELGGQDGGSIVIAILADLVEVPSLGLGQGIHGPIIDDEHVGAGNLTKELVEGAVGSSHGQIAKESSGPSVQSRPTVPSRFLSEGTGQEGFADANRSSHIRLTFPIL